MRDSVTGGASRRTLWRLLETYHALVYYADERPEVYSSLGLKGGWMGYFATRSAALGPVDPGVVTACFYSFADPMVRRALPDAWRLTTPERALEARYDVVDRAGRRLLGDRAQSPPVGELADRLAEVVGTLAPHGRPMFAAHASAPRPDAAHLRLFWAATALREYRGDAHVTALQAAGVSPAASNVLMAALRMVPADQRTFRGWTLAEWEAAASELRDRGWLDEDGEATREGRRRRARIEQVTDELTDDAWQPLDDDRVAGMVGELGVLVEPIVTAGAVPYPNGMGVAPLGELAVHR